jgi:hypothetical protein
MVSGRLIRQSATLVALGTFVATLLATAPARAFCRSNSCDPSRGEVCFSDIEGCLQGGMPLEWASSCTTFAVQRDGSPKHQIDAAAFEEVITRAFATWMAAECSATARPSISVSSLGQVACNTPQYNEGHANANVYMFHDEEWPRPDADQVYAITTTKYDWKTGEIYDVDTEVNGTMDTITNSDPEDGADLPSIITHEAGHFLGLDHSRDPLATMFRRYEAGGRSLRELAADDIAGICTIYPPERLPASDDCTPRFGFSGECWEEEGGCGCRVGGSRPGRAGAATSLAAFALLLLRRRGRREAH